MKQQQLGDLKIAYECLGDGPTVVLLHGGITDSRTWRHQLAGLSDEFTVMAWDAPGCGRSSDVPESWRLPDYARALAAWLDSRGVSRAHMLGLSWGSSVALEFYHRYPRIPQSLILASAYAGWAGSLPSGEVSKRLDRALAAADLPREDMLKNWPDLFGPNAGVVVRQEEAEIAADNTGIRHPGGYRAVVRSMAAADLTPTLMHIRVPTLLLYGALDGRSPVHIGHRLNAAINGSKLVVMEGAGHLVHVEAPREFNELIRQFVRDIQ
jgi:pimeloyl-ACP methyl ester carboxylesterase